MFCKLNSYCLNGIDALPIEVEIDLHSGLPGFDIVGLPDCAVKEAKEGGYDELTKIHQAAYDRYLAKLK